MRVAALTGATLVAVALAEPAHGAVRVVPPIAVPGAAVSVAPAGAKATLHVRIGGRAAKVLSASGGRARVVVPRLRPGRAAVVVGRARGRMTIERPFTGAVRETLDRRRSSTRSIGPAGGTVRSGRFTLAVPAGALARRTAITITPVARIRGLPLSGRSAAVRLAPDGLTFAVPATLTIERLRGKLVAFTASGSGRGVIFLHAAAGHGRARVEIDHFSSSGAGGTTPADFAAAVAPLLAGLGPLTEGEIETLVHEVALWADLFGPSFCETQPVCADAVERAVRSLDALIPRRCTALKTTPSRSGVHELLKLDGLHVQLDGNHSPPAVDCIGALMTSLVDAAVSAIQPDPLADAGTENDVTPAELLSADLDGDHALSRFEWLSLLGTDAATLGLTDLQVEAINAMDGAFDQIRTSGLDGCETDRTAGAARLARGNAYATHVGGVSREDQFARAIDACTIDVTVDPADVSLGAGATQAFTARVTSRLDTSVAWTATAGQISQAGVYVAPTQPGTYIVRATSNANPRRSATATVRVGCADPSCQVDVTLDSRSSEVDSNADGNGLNDPHQQQLDGPGDFHGNVSSSATSMCCDGTGSATQDSSAATSSTGLSVTASGSVGATATGPGTVGTVGAGVGESLISVNFTVGKSQNYSISATRSVPAGGTATITLAGPGGTVYDVSGSPASQSGTLPPGTYTLSVDTQANAEVNATTNTTSSTGSFSVTLSVTA